MNRIQTYVSAHPFVQLDEAEHAWNIRIEKEEATFSITVPLKIHELFWKVDVRNETIFEDWNDYYEGGDESQEKEKVEDCIKLMDSFTNLESFRIDTDGSVMKTKKLSILRDGSWKELNEEIWGEPGSRGNVG